jgi:O-methyltransferase involved in polyketide biosynthesis
MSSKIFRVLQQFLHSDQVVSKLSNTDVMMKAARIAHELKDQAKIIADRSAQQFEEQFAPSAANKKLEKLSQGSQRLLEDAKHDWELLKSKLGNKKNPQ